MGAVMHKPFETKAPPVATIRHSPTLPHSLSLLFLHVVCMCIMCVKHISVSVLSAKSQRRARTKTTKPLSRPIWVREGEGETTLLSSPWLGISTI